MLLGIIVVLAVAYFANRAVRDARNHATAGPRTRGQRARAARPRPVSSGRAVPAARSAGRGVSTAIALPGALWTGFAEQRRHHRANSMPASAASSNGDGQVIYPDYVTDSLNGSRRGARRTAEARQDGPPARPSPPPPAPPATTNGGTPVSNGTAGAEQLIEGINRVHAEAAAGGIHHKQAALKASTEGSVRFSGMAQMLARTMSEPGNNYGPEITEPLGKAAQHLQAAGMAFTEADNALTSLIHMSVGDLATSPRQAPHHSELSENGAK